MRYKPNLLIFDLVFKLNLGQSQQHSRFRDIKILICSNSYNVFGFQMSIKDYCQLKARLKSHNILGELYLILKNKRQTPQKTLHLISSLSSYPRTNQCYGLGVKVHNVWVTKCLYTNLRTPWNPMEICFHVFRPDRHTNGLMSKNTVLISKECFP